MNTKTNKALPPDLENMNGERAEFAQVALDAFAEETNQKISGDDEQTILIDLIADFGHWCDRNDLDFSAIVSSAQAQYAEDTRAE